MNDLSASRTGNVVELRFTVPHLSTDKLPLYDARKHRTTLRGLVCRETDSSGCVAETTIQPQLTATDHSEFIWRDQLPPNLRSGTPHLLAYRVEFLNSSNKSAGKSAAAYTAAGDSPAQVTGLTVTGARSGTVVQWDASAASGEVLLHRLNLNPHVVAPTRAKGVISRSADVDDLWLNTNANGTRTLDTTVKANVPYRYTAERRVTLTLAGHNVEVRSEPSSAVEFTLHPAYAPAVPTGLNATGFTPPVTTGISHFAVDLIWQPVNDAGISADLAAPLAGYNVYREQLDVAGNVIAARVRLTATPTLQPSLHDATVEPTARYRYSVTSVDGNGNESKAATFTEEPSPQ